MRSLLFLLCAISSIQCDKDDDPIPCMDCGGSDTTATQLKIIWKAPMNPDTTDCYSMRPLIINGDVAYSLLFYKDGYELFRMRDGKTGALKWAWDPEYPTESTSKSKGQLGNNLLISHWNRKYCINTDNGSLKWQKDFGLDSGMSFPGIGVAGGYLYATVAKEPYSDTLSHLIKADVETGKWDTVFTQKRIEGFRPNLHSPALWVNAANEQVLVFQNRQWDFSGSKGRIDLLAYNLNQKKLEWTANDIEPSGNSSIQSPPLIHNDNVYFLGLNTVYCYDLKTGQQRWKKTMGQANDNLLESNAIVANNILWVKPTNEKKLYGLSLDSGTEIQSFKDAGLGGAYLNYHDGKIYYASKGDGLLFAFDIINRKMLWNYNSPFKVGSSLFYEITVSPESNCLYAFDKYYIMAIELAK